MAIEAHFADCARRQLCDADFACMDASSRLWVIEAKGETTDVGLDFRNGLGQLVQATPDGMWTPALAMPDTAKFAYQGNKTPEFAN